MGENESKQKVKEIAIAVAVCAVVLTGLLGLAAGLYNIFYDKNSNSTETIANTENDEQSGDISVKLEDTEVLDEIIEEEEKEESEEEKEEEELTEEEKQKREEERKKREEEQRKLASQGYPYWIRVNYSANTTTVYAKDENGNYTVPVRAMVCSTGRQTPHSGVYRTSDKYRWGTLIGPVWGQYCTRITGGILFHSVPYLKKNDNSSLEYWEYDRLGEQRSLGCIRLTVIDAQWIYYNCPSGTSVEFYSDPANPGPWGKPGIQPVTAAGDPYKGWDPTDPDPNNPWRQKEEIERQKKAEEEAAKRAEEEKQAQEAAKRAEEERQAQEKARLEQEEAERKAQEEASKIEVPNVIGMSEGEARNALKNNFTISQSITISDNTKNEGVVAQSPEAGTRVKKGETITLTINHKNTTEPENPNENSGEETPGDNNSSNENENSQSNENP